GGERREQDDGGQRQQPRHRFGQVQPAGEGDAGEPDGVGPDPERRDHQHHGQHAPASSRFPPGAPAPPVGSSPAPGPGSPRSSRPPDPPRPRAAASPTSASSTGAPAGRKGVVTTATAAPSSAARRAVGSR